MNIVKKVLRPNILIPLLLLAGLAVTLLGLTDIRKVFSLIATFQPGSLLLLVPLLLAYEVVRGVQWVLLLRTLHTRAPLRSEVFAFAVGEVTKALPIGNYVQNYLLQESRGEDFGRSSAATTLIILIEVAVSLLGVVIFGDGVWTLGLRIAIVGGVALAALLATLAVKLHHGHAPPDWMTRRKRIRQALDEFQRFREGARALLRPRALAPATLLGAAYLTIAGATLFVVARSLGVHVNFSEALSVYYLSLAIALIFPLPIDLGVIELGMVGAFAAMGVSRNAGLGVSLVNRAVSIGGSIVVAFVVIAIFHDELGAALHNRGRKGQQSAPQPGRERRDERDHTRRKEQALAGERTPQPGATRLSPPPSTPTPAPPRRYVALAARVVRAPRLWRGALLLGVAATVAFALALTVQQGARLIVRARRGDRRAPEPPGYLPAG